MKKTQLLKVAAALVLVLAMVLSLAACGSPEGVEGTWKLTEMKMGDLTMSMDDLASMGLDVDMTLEFKADGTVLANLGDENGTGTYTLEGSKLVITIDDVPEEFEYDAGAGVIRMTEPSTGAEVIFKR